MAWRRIEVKHIALSETTEMWNSQNRLIAEKDCIYIYKDYEKRCLNDGTIENVPAVKVGDGTSYLIDMPFAVVGDRQAIADMVAVAHIQAKNPDGIPWGLGFDIYIDDATSTLMFKRRNKNG